ncbi:MAG: FMN-binding protein [Clostridiales bacterium]|jgi:major membrane immunogen (membrane-anchored lipoprotein)|nr:FMN-binding protein [Clostridiales bacterium]
MKKKAALFLISATVASAVSACGGTVKPPTPGAAAYKQGTYTAEDAEYDDSGYKQTISIAIGADGKITDVDWDGINKDGGPSKKELGDEYGMKKASGIGKEWYEQAAVMEQELIKTQDPAAIPMTPEGYADGISGCTIHINDFVALAEEALKKAE